MSDCRLFDSSVGPLSCTCRIPAPILNEALNQYPTSTNQHPTSTHMCMSASARACCSLHLVLWPHHNTVPKTSEDPTNPLAALSCFGLSPHRAAGYNPRLRHTIQLAFPLAQSSRSGASSWPVSYTLCRFGIPRVLSLCFWFHSVSCSCQTPNVMAGWQRRQVMGPRLVMRSMSQTYES